jgi:hypothetical protein
VKKYDNDEQYGDCNEHDSAIALYVLPHDKPPLIEPSPWLSKPNLPDLSWREYGYAASQGTSIPSIMA